MIKKILCIIGLHRWYYIKRFAITDTIKCAWCGVDGIGTPDGPIIKGR